MRWLLIMVLSLAMATSLCAQSTSNAITVLKAPPKHQPNLVPYIVGPGLRMLPANNSATESSSVMFTTTVYSYNQGKLPLFCALEDRIWRRVGLGMQFRLIDRPLGFR